MFELNDKVRILESGIIGTVVDVSTEGGESQYIVESDTPYVEGGYGGKWKLFDCHAEDIAQVQDSDYQKRA